MVDACQAPSVKLNPVLNFGMRIMQVLIALLETRYLAILVASLLGDLAVKVQSAIAVYFIFIL